jgi:hypothetical protein
MRINAHQVAVAIASALRSAVAIRFAAATIMTVMWGCGGAVASEKDDGGNSGGAVATGGVAAPGSGSGRGTGPGGGDGEMWNVIAGASSSGSWTASFGHPRIGGGSGSSSGGMGAMLGTSADCSALADGTVVSAGECRTSLNGTCHGTDYYAECGCPQGQCVCLAAVGHPDQAVTFPVLSTCAACPTAAQAATNCGFPF